MTSTSAVWPGAFPSGPSQVTRVASIASASATYIAAYVPVAEETRLDFLTERSLQQHLRHRGSIDDNHADSRSSRMIAAADVFSLTRERA